MAPKKATKKAPTQDVGLHSRVTEKLFQQIANLAASEHRTVSNIVRILLEEALAHRQGRAQ